MKTIPIPTDKESFDHLYNICPSKTKVNGLYVRVYVTVTGYFPFVCGAFSQAGSHEASWLYVVLVFHRARQ